jgi:hypothetical protein
VERRRPRLGGERVAGLEDGDVVTAARDVYAGLSPALLPWSDLTDLLALPQALATEGKYAT